MQFDTSTFALAVSAVVVGWLLNNYRDKSRTLGKVVYKIMEISNGMLLANNHMNMFTENLPSSISLADYKQFEEFRSQFCSALDELKYDETIILELASIDPFAAYMLNAHITEYQGLFAAQRSHSGKIDTERQNERSYYLYLVSLERGKDFCQKEVYSLAKRLALRFSVFTFIKFSTLSIHPDPAKEKSFLKFLEDHLATLKPFK